MVADLDGNLDLEIVTAHSGGYLSVYDQAGYFQPGWPQTPSGGLELCGLSAYDLDGDGDLEIIATGAVYGETNTWVYEHNGNLRPGWPQLTNDSGASGGLLVTNPPYGERIGDQERLQSLYATLGEKLRESFVGWKAAVLTGNPPLAKAIGIHARRSHTLFNGRIQCRLLRFEVTADSVRPHERVIADEAEIRARPGAQMFANRLRKNVKALLDWARREQVDCLRLYDADMPEYTFASDQYGDGAERWVVVQEYAAPRTVRCRRRDNAGLKPSP